MQRPSAKSMIRTVSGSWGSSLSPISTQICVPRPAKVVCWEVASQQVLTEASHCGSNAMLVGRHLKVHVGRCLIVTHLLTPLCLPVDKVLYHRGGATSSSAGTCSSRRTALATLMQSAVAQVHACSRRAPLASCRHPAAACSAMLKAEVLLRASL